MNELVNRFISDAERAASNGEYVDAGQYYEKAAGITRYKSQAAKLLKKAAETYRDCWMQEDAERCSQHAIELMDCNQKARYLLECWKNIVETIVHFEYDCSFEWRGETDGSHDSYQEDIDLYQKKAENVLRRALDVNGVDKDVLIEKAREECRKREEEGGWGSARCWDTIRNVI